MQEYDIFLTSVDYTLDNVIKLLGSKSMFDITEAIKLIMVLNKYGIEKSELGIKKILVLIWSKQ
jgi:hypothetical protein